MALRSCYTPQAHEHLKNTKALVRQPSQLTRDEEDSAVPPCLVASAHRKKKGGPKGARTLDLHNAIVALSQAELWAHAAWCATHLIMRNGHFRRSLLMFDCAAPGRVRPRRSSGHPAGFALSPAHCDDGLLLPFTAVGTVYFVKCDRHSSGARGACQGVFSRGVRRSGVAWRAQKRRMGAGLLQRVLNQTRSQTISITENMLHHRIALTTLGACRLQHCEDIIVKNEASRYHKILRLPQASAQAACVGVCHGCACGPGSG